MSSTTIAQPMQTVLPEMTDLLWLFVLLTGGLVGMSIRNMLEGIVSDEDDGTSESAEDDLDGGGLMADGDDGDDEELGGLGGLDDGDDLGGFGDDEFDGMDEGGGGGGGNVDELEHRLDELENEVGSLSSTVNTVRNENEQISESVEEVEENVRKLLDIYEMVTRGVNPFADDIDAGMGGGMGDGGSFGLFDNDDGDDDGEELDSDIAEADAEGFFDDDLVEDDGEMEASADVDDVLGGGDDTGGDEFEETFDEGDDFNEGDDFDESGGGDDSEGGGTSFADLKEEYESGDADWAEEDKAEQDDALALDDDLEGADDEMETNDDDLAGDELFDDVIEEEPEESGDEPEQSVVEESSEPEPEPDVEPEPTEPEPEPDVEPEPTETSVGEPAEPTATEPDPTDAAAAEQEPAASAASTDGTETSGQGKPYLDTLPEGFGADLIVIEWLEFLVEEAGVRETARAVNYYENIDWIDQQVADSLQEYLQGFESSGDGTLTIDHHTQSLKYISQLNGGGASAAVGMMGGGLDGLQR